MMDLTNEQRDLLRHTLGVHSGIKPRDYGYRNRFQATVGSDNYQALTELVTLGLMIKGGTANEGRQQWFHATEAGCRALDFNAKQIANAME